MADSDFFAAPAFKADEALQTLKRQLRELGLTEREGRFERRGVLIARAALVDGAIDAARVQRPSRNSPQWLNKSLNSSAAVRDFVADLKRQLAQWSDKDD